MKTMTPKELKAIRKKFGWSQADLAERLATTRTSVSRWEAALVPVAARVATHIRLLADTEPKRRKTSKPKNGNR